MVKFFWVTDELVTAYGNLLENPAKARTVLNKAVQLRQAADSHDPRVTYINPGDLPLLANVGAYAFWQEVFSEACKHGPRMLAALLLAQPDDMFEPAARSDRAKLLHDLRGMNQTEATQ